MKIFRRGQSTLEYLIILSAVVAAIVVVANLLKPKIQGSYNTLGNTMRDKVESVHFN